MPQHRASQRNYTGHAITRNRKEDYPMEFLLIFIIGLLWQINKTAHAIHSNLHAVALMLDEDEED